MRKIKRRNFLIIAILAVSLLISACQSQKKETPDKKSSQKADAEAILSATKAKTLDGTFVDTKYIFSLAELTVINIWNPSCAACQNDMEALGKLGREYAGKGIQMLGIIRDVTTENDPDSLAVIEKSDTDYTQLLDSEEIKTQLSGKFKDLPVTIFVDRDGKQLGEAYTQSKDESQWREKIESAHSNVCVGDHPAEQGGG